MSRYHSVSGLNVIDNHFHLGLDHNGWTLLSLFW